ncbi:hypothetical protein H5410_002648 [Solanum commersonii]|uniref:Uncharacterized protein n=1 Tax=Solanum commersonii TaxID=4109 RepID=A0A9J6B2V4_SOLCO|nr:hypothetical protein H5410_002648 [Solanum commersonii]
MEHIPELITEEENAELGDCEKQSSQRINKNKSSYYLHQNVAVVVATQVEQITGMDAPITHARKSKEHYSELLNKIKGRLQSWKGIMLSYGGKEVLLVSVLQSIPIYVLSPITLPMCVIKENHRIFAKLYWSNKKDGRNKHWSKWIDVCLPKIEGGLGFRSMFDVSKAMYAKLWWISKHGMQCGLTLCGLSIVRNKFLHLFNGKEVPSMEEHAGK